MSDDKAVSLIPSAGDPTNPTQAEINAMEALLAQEALIFIQQNGQQIFDLGSDYIKAILFKNAVEFVDIPVVSDPNNLTAIVEKERYLRARNIAFQLVAKAELERYHSFLIISKNAQDFLIAIGKKLGVMAGAYLVKVLIGMILV